MPTVVLKLFAGQCTERLLYASSFGEHNNTCKTYIYNYMQCLITNMGSVGQYRFRSKWRSGWFGGATQCGVAVKLAGVVGHLS